MKNTLSELIEYLKKPLLENDNNKDNSYRFKKFIHLLSISILTGIILTPLFVLIESIGLIDMNKHAMEELMKSMSKIKIFLLVVIAAPLLEEMIFRAPITLFRHTKHFNIVFYTFAIIFGLVHLSNFQPTPNLILLFPLLVAPQIILGGYLGFIRVRFGLIWSIFLHASYNAFFVLISFSADLI